MKKLFLILAVALSGCAAPAPVIQYVPQEVKIEVPVKCTAPKVDKPDRTFDQAKKDDLLYNNLALLAAENDNLSGYTIKLEAALSACSKP